MQHIFPDQEGAKLRGGVISNYGNRSSARNDNIYSYTYMEKHYLLTYLLNVYFIQNILPKNKYICNIIAIPHRGRILYDFYDAFEEVSINLLE